MKSRCLSNTFCEAWHRGSQSKAPFWNSYMYIYRESVTIFFHSFQVINMIFSMCWLIFCDKGGIGDIFITMNDSSLFWHPNQFFKIVICNLQHAFELFGNGSWVFQNFGPLEPLTKALPWTHRGPCSLQHHFQVFKFWQLSPLVLLFYWIVFSLHSKAVTTRMFNTGGAPCVTPVSAVQLWWYREESHSCVENVNTNI